MDRDRTEQAAARDAFRVRLSDTLRPLTDAVEIQAMAARLLGEQLALDRCGYGEVDDGGTFVTIHRDYHRGDLAALAGRVRLEDLAGDLTCALRAGRNYVLSDGDGERPLADPRSGAAFAGPLVRAAVAVPLLKDGRLAAALFAQCCEARVWRADEVALVEEVAERTRAAIERARAERALREREDRYRSLFDSIDEGFVIAELLYDDAGNPFDVEVLETNPSFDRLLGTTQAVGKRGKEIFPDLETHWMDAFTHVVETGESLRFENHLAARDAWFELYISRVGGQGGRRFAVVFNETTQRKRAEERQAFLLEFSDALRQLSDPLEIQATAARLLGERLNADRAMYGDILETHGVWTCVVERNYLAPNVPPIIGRFRAEDFGQVIVTENLAGRSMVVPDVNAKALFSESERKAFRELGIRAFVSTPLVKNGRWIALIIAQSLSPRVWTQPEVELLEEVAERTWAAVERARAEAALRASEARLKLALDAANMGTFVWYPHEDRAEPDAQTLALFGAPESIRSFARWRELILDEDRRLHAAAVARALDASGDGMLRSEHRIVRPRDGAERWIATLGKTQFAGEPPVAVAVVGVCSDITERKKAEELLRLSEQRARTLLAEATAARAQAESANRAKDEFLATLSHELRTPLAAILLWARALRTGAVPPSQLARAIAAIADSAESQSRLIEDLLDLSRLAADKLLLTRSAVDVGAFAEAALEMLKPMAAAKSLVLACEVDADLGVAMLDGARVKQILWNLVTNATKFTPANGKVTVSIRKRAGHLELDVADTGEGISPEFLPYVFDRFRQADMGETRRHMGLGIGLALAKQLATLHGGSIEATSEGLGRGALFRVRLPWLEPDDSAINEREREAADTGGLGVSPLNHLHVLLVEDDVNTREAMKWMLEHAGADVIAVGSGGEALAVLRTEDAEPPRREVILSDLGLPGMSGYELMAQVTRHCRSRGRKIPPAGAISAHARDVDRERAFAVGFDVYVTKPVTPDRLVQAMLDLDTLAKAQR